MNHFNLTLELVMDNEKRLKWPLDEDGKDSTLQRLSFSMTTLMSWQESDSKSVSNPLPLKECNHAGGRLRA